MCVDLVVVDDALLVVQERTKKMLLEHEIHLEDFGGDVQSVCISALKVSDSDTQLQLKLKAHTCQSV